MPLKMPLWVLLTLTLMSTSVQSVELNIATVNNGHMIAMQKLSGEFEAINPDITLRWHVYNEGSLRMRVIADIASGEGNYDVMTIGMYELPLWAGRKWLVELAPSPSYDMEDLIPAVREGLSYNNRLFAAPFYGESSMLMYRQDLVAQAGMKVTDRMSWDEIENVAKAIHNPEQGIYGVCLRGKAGWGDNMALVSTIVNSFGGQWFDMNWRPQINSPVWQEAVSFYVHLLSTYGPPNSERNSFNEILSLMRNGKCGMWIDASIAASFVSDTQSSQVGEKMAFAQSPIKRTERGANWLWAWALAIPKGTKNAEAAQRFVEWATSKQYIETAAKYNGWGSVPTGTRRSTYSNPAFLEVADKFASAELAAMNSADPKNNTLRQSPYAGIQFVPIPEFGSIGGLAGQKIAEALQGNISVEQALNDAQRNAEREMRRAGY